MVKDTIADTIIRLKYSTKKRLNKAKIMDRETYDQVINRLLNSYNQIKKQGFIVKK